MVQSFSIKYLIWTWNFSITNKKENTSNSVLVFHKIYNQSQSCLPKDADQAFFQNVRKLLCILAVSPIATTTIGSTDTKQFLFGLSQVHTLLHATTTEEWQGNLQVIDLHGWSNKLTSLYSVISSSIYIKEE